MDLEHSAIVGADYVVILGFLALCVIFGERRDGDG